MFRLIRVLSVSVPLLFIFLVAPSAFAQSWISAVTATKTSTTATITWTTAVPANSQITYGTTTSYGSSSTLNSSLVTTHSVALTSLTAGTTYHYRVLSADSTGVVVTGLDNVFTTPTAAISVSISPTTATVTSGGTQQFSAQVTNTSNTAVTWSATSGTVSTTGLFTAPTVTATKTVTVTATSVADNTKSASATVTVNAAAAGILTLNPTSISFGSVTVGQTSPILLTTLTNTGNASLTITSNPMSAGDFNWGGKGTCNLNTLAPGSSCTMSAIFKPTATGTRTGTITINSTASNSTVTVPLSGIGTTATAGTLGVSPTTLSLGSVVVGQSGTASGTITASGASVTVTAATSSNSVFSVSGLALPVTIPAGQSVPFTITFSPMVSGTVNATLTLTSNANPATITEGLTGSGTAAATHSVALSWNASTSLGIVGYNVYRAPYTTSCGAYAKLNPALNTGTLYTDTTVANGNNYCYATTAVDTSSRESSYSNVVSNVQVPVL
jgi:hypothetical protein